MGEKWVSLWVCEYVRERKRVCEPYAGWQALVTHTHALPHTVFKEEAQMLDVKTVLFSYIVTSILITFFMALLWYRNRRRYAGLDLWLAGFTLQALGNGVAHAA